MAGSHESPVSCLFVAAQGAHAGVSSRTKKTPPAMSILAPLLEIQGLDLAADAARSRFEELPERQFLPRLEAELAALDEQLVTARGERVASEGVEKEISNEVVQVARDIEAAELDRYSGKRMDREEAAAHQEAQALLRAKQASLEERELELLESIETVENRIEELESISAEKRVESERSREAIHKTEAEVAIELESIEKSRFELVQTVPELVLSAYERVRGQPRAAGRGAAILAEGGCRGCRIKLPAVERKRMLSEPGEALIQCPQCRRVLVR